MPKSSSLAWPLPVDQDVGRLDVAVDDQVRVRVRDRLEHVEEEARRGPRRPERSAVAVRVDRLALDVLEDEVRLARAGDAGVEQAGDVRVGEPREDVALRRKRSSPARPTRLAFRSLTAAAPSKRPSLRRASQTLPMPPCPICDTSV